MTIDIKAMPQTVTTPGQVTISISSDEPNTTVPLAVAPGTIGRPADPGWFSAQGLPLPLLVNLDDGGRGGLVVDVKSPVVVATGEYEAIFGAGYATEAANRVTVSVRVVSVAVPDIIGMTQEVATVAVTQVGLTVGQVQGITGAHSLVQSQVPSAGVVAVQGSPVDMRVLPADAVSAGIVHLVNNHFHEVDVWVWDLTVDSWTKATVHPLPGNAGLNLPPDGPVCEVDPPDGHYLQLAAASSDFTFQPGDSMNWLAPNLISGAHGGPVIRLEIRWPYD